MTKTPWPTGVSVGHTTPGYGSDPSERKVVLDCPRRLLTPDEARAVAQELLLRADFQERSPETYSENEVPRRRT